ncbi:MAG: hypothetical protein BWX85_00736 [Chloroflexi bacterium ADurb.Bin120]|nr:MAG: hypothetical protein BWX85_00736 [Chloroflexi bacterium ADurb.Bin120]
MKIIQVSQDDNFAVGINLQQGFHEIIDDLSLGIASNLGVQYWWLDGAKQGVISALGNEMVVDHKQGLILDEERDDQWFATVGESRIGRVNPPRVE